MRSKIFVGTFIRSTGCQDDVRVKTAIRELLQFGKTTLSWSTPYLLLVGSTDCVLLRAIFILKVNTSRNAERVLASS